MDDEETLTDLESFLYGLGHTLECAKEIVNGEGYPLDDDGGVCWCGLPPGWRKPTQEELDARD